MEEWTMTTMTKEKFIGAAKVRQIIDDFIPAQQIFTVLFRKLDGSLRLMNCRRDMRAPGIRRRPSASTINVFDLHVNDYRSFRIDRVVEIRGFGLNIRAS
jgi:hypothetical protein